MRRKTLTYLFVACCILFGLCARNEKQTLRVMEPVPFSKVKITDRFWDLRLQRHADVTLPLCIDQIENQTARIRNFENAAAKTGEYKGLLFDDSDVYKAMEGMAYSLINRPNPQMEAKIDEWVDKIAAAQQPDGYINTYYTLKQGLDKRWTNMHNHEMYCGGHMIEAAVAYYQATGKRNFLDVAIRFADHLIDTFGSGQKHWIAGHQEIELALVKLFHVTEDERYLKMAEWILEERGHGYGTDVKYSYIGDRIWSVAYDPKYCQDDKPVRDQSVIAGHAVRAMYMYCGMADVAAVTHDQGYIDALNRLWESVALRNMYITGGVGSSRHNEGFTEDYDLPNEEAYCETCASVGMVLWNHRMNQLSGDAKYVDVLERALYNGALAGISLAGDRFFYVNPLESQGNHHRKEWFGCACCPGQVSRFLPSIGSYIYGRSDDALWVNLFIASETETNVGKTNVAVKQETQCPWDGKVVLTVTPQKTKQFDVKIRKPQWSETYTLSINGEPRTVSPSADGYLTLNRKWKANDQIEIDWQMKTVPTAADPRVKADVGKRAVQRGPLVYCLEQTDNPKYDNAMLTANTDFEADFYPTLLDGITAVTTNQGKENALVFIPYYAWDNRDAGKMKVWVDYRE